MVRVLAFVQDDEHDYAWAHPVDGVAAYVDLIERRVFELVDEFVAAGARRSPVTTTTRPSAGRTGPRCGRSRSPSRRARASPSTGHLLRWQGWSMRIGFDAREGLTLHQISVGDGGRDRPVIYRASIPEMVVPYGDPKFRYWQTYFDTRRVPGREVGELARAGLRLPRRDRLPGRDGDRRQRRAADDPQRDLHPRGGLRDPLEAHGHLQRLGPVPPPAPPGGLVLHHRRQLRLRLLLVLLPRRHDRVRDQADRRAVHRRAPGREPPALHRGRAGPGRARPPAPVQRAARHGRGRAGQRGGGGGRRRAARRTGQPVRQRAGAGGHPAEHGVAGGPAGRRQPRPDLAGGEHRAGQPVRSPGRLHPVPGGGPGAAGRPGLLGGGPGRLRRATPVGHPVRPRAAVPGRGLREPASGRSGPAGLHRAATGTSTGPTSCCGTPSGPRTSPGWRTGR